MSSITSLNSAFEVQNNGFGGSFFPLSRGWLIPCVCTYTCTHIYGQWWVNHTNSWLFNKSVCADVRRPKSHGERVVFLAVGASGSWHNENRATLSLRQGVISSILAAWISGASPRAERNWSAVGREGEQCGRGLETDAYDFITESC